MITHTYIQDTNQKISVLQHAKGLVVLSVLKGGFLFSGRVGSGLVIARLPDGSWSAPSAIGTAGIGVGGQIGGELTDFVMILNNRAAVESFAQLGSVTLGGNISVAAGPIGRNAEAAGTASLKNVAAIFSYSKTKGLFAGVSLEGSVMIERRDANSKFYNQKVTAKQLLTGRVPAPPGADLLYRVLNSRAFSGNANGNGSGGGNDDDMYNDVPVYGDEDDSIWGGQRGDGFGEGQTRSRADSSTSGGGDSRRRGDTPARDEYDDVDEYDNFESQFKNRTFKSSYSDVPRNSSNTGGSASRSNTASSTGGGGGGGAPARPTAPKPSFTRKEDLSANQAIAKFTFQGEQSGDLSFKKGDVIEVTKRTGSNNVCYPFFWHSNVLCVQHGSCRLGRLNWILAPYVSHFYAGKVRTLY